MAICIETIARQGEGGVAKLSDARESIYLIEGGQISPASSGSPDPATSWPGR